jgi:DNA transposition AAA+ family ATPase
MRRTLPPGYRVDWFRLIGELGAGGVSTYDIAARIGVCQATVMAWRNGTEPRHMDGETVIRLWLQLTQAKPDTVPTVRRELSRFRAADR